MPITQPIWSLIVAVFALFCIGIAWRQKWFSTRESPLTTLPAETAARLMGVGLIAFVLWYGGFGAVAKLPFQHWFALNQPQATVVAMILGNLSGLLLLVMLATFLELPILCKRDPEPGMIDCLRWAFVCLVMAVPVVMATEQATGLLLDLIQLEHPPGHELLNLIRGGDRFLIALVIFSAVFAAPLFEELFFRGVVQRAMLGLTNSPWGAIVLSSAVFMLVHSWWLWPPIFVLSLALGLLYQRTASLLTVILAHAGFNALSLAITLLNHRPPT